TDGQGAAGVIAVRCVGQSSVLAETDLGEIDAARGGVIGIGSERTADRWIDDEGAAVRIFREKPGGCAVVSNEVQVDAVRSVAHRKRAAGCGTAVCGGHEF